MNGQKSGAAMVATVAMAPSSLDTLDTIHSINDPKWRVTENLRDYWAQQGPTRCIPELGWEVCCFLMHPLFLGWSITWSDNHYSNNEASTCKLLFDTLPYLLRWRWRRSSTYLLITAVYLLDVWSVHISEDFLTHLKDKAPREVNSGQLYQPKV